MRWNQLNLMELSLKWDKKRLSGDKQQRLHNTRDMCECVNVSNSLRVVSESCKVEAPEL